MWRSTDLPRNPSLPAIALLPFTSRDDVAVAAALLAVGARTFRRENG